ncbi:hypothetical protein PG996_000092 [Apiospora saccharicola]|uniref:Uncharacterized protein n=1 Tax=Apiospora saccharicola TaxID=335842 RepID=A0ABR1WCT0_9PEZI
MRSPAGKEATDQMDAESDARPALALASRRIDRIRGWSGELHSMIRPPSSSSSSTDPEAAPPEVPEPR